jgi:hypothetical protein
MSELRRLRMRIGEAEFEADVPESEVQPMYCQFLSMLERRGQPPLPLLGTGAKGAQPVAGVRAQSVNGYSTEPRGEPSGEPPADSFDEALLARIFDLRQDGAITLKVLPAGPDTHADAVLLLLYGYHRIKREHYVLVTQLFRAAEQSGIALRRPVSQYVRNSSFVIRGGRRKGSHYSLSREGLAVAQELTAQLLA